MRRRNQAVVQRQRDGAELVPELIILLRVLEKVKPSNCFLRHLIRGVVLLHLCAHFQVNGVCRACTWASVTQSKEHRALGLLGVQEQNPLNPAPHSLQPIQLQFCSQVCAEEKGDVRACLDPFMPGSSFHWEGTGAWDGLLTDRRGDPHSAHGCTHVHFQAAGRQECDHTCCLTRSLSSSEAGCSGWQ